MARCDGCGNDDDKTFEVKKDDRTYNFDCFECAVHVLAPVCEHCACKVLGHGVEQAGSIFCCAHCAREMGRMSLKDRAEPATADEMWP
jgi:hypothetical protein